MPLGSRLTPYRFLAAILVLAAGFASLFAAVPAGDPSLQVVDVFAAVLLVLLAVLTRFVLPRVPGSWGLDAVILFITLLACYGTAIVPSPQGQVITGIGLMLFGVFTAYFRPPRRVVIVLATMVAGFAVATAVNPVLPNPVDVLVVAAAIVGVPAMVSVLAERLRQLSLRDPLTGAYNRRGLDLLAAPVGATAARSGTPVTVGLIDLDSFKSYNDEHGHVAGDALLAEIAASWQDRLRRSDVLVRYGGDEFAVVLPGTTQDEAERLAAGVQQAHPAPWSAGFTRWDPGEDLYAALARADAEMFRTKRDRRAP